MRLDGKQRNCSFAEIHGKVEKYIIESKWQKEDTLLKESMENEAFCLGVAVGVNIVQQNIVKASQKKEPIKIGDELYYVQSGRERLKEMIDIICK